MTPRSLFVTLLIVGLAVVAGGLGIAAGQAAGPRIVMMASTIGPIDAGIVAALRKIATAQAVFVTRGDNSGTHVKEVELWRAAGIGPAGAWYVKSERGAAGNAPTTRDADTRGAYVLMDRATYLTLKKEVALQVLVERDPDLLNYIAVIRVNAARLPRVNAEGARAFQEWLVSDEAQRLIKTFEVERYGEPLFFPNSDDWRKRHGGSS